MVFFWSAAARRRFRFCKRHLIRYFPAPRNSTRPMSRKTCNRCRISSFYFQISIFDSLLIADGLLVPDGSSLNDGDAGVEGNLVQHDVAADPPGATWQSNCKL